MRVGGNTSHVEYATGALVRFAKGKTASAEPATPTRPVYRVESGARAPPAREPGRDTFRACGDFVGECGNQKLFQLGICACS